MAIPTMQRATFRPADSTRELALTAPMLLFAHGILGWIDQLGGHGGSGVVWLVAQASLVGAVLAFSGVAVGLRRAAGGGPVMTAATGGTVSGALLTAWVVVAAGLERVPPTAVAPAGLIAAGAILIAVGLLVLLTHFVRAGRLGPRSFGLVAVGALLTAVPGDLTPLAALAILIGIEPLLAAPGDD